MEKSPKEMKESLYRLVYELQRQVSNGEILRQRAETEIRREYNRVYGSDKA